MKYQIYLFDIFLSSIQNENQKYKDLEKIGNFLEGSIVGFVIVSLGFAAVSWGKVGTIAASWVVSPAISGIMAFCIFLSAKKFILDRRDPVQAAVSLIPFYSFFVAVIIGLVTARKGLKHVGLPLTDNEVVLITLIFGVAVSIITAVLLNLNKTGKNSLSMGCNSCKKSRAERVREKQKEKLKESEKENKFVNPNIIPRNHIIENILNECKVGNYKKFNRFISFLKNPYNSDIPEEFSKEPSNEERVYETFCGT